MGMRLWEEREGDEERKCYIDGENEGNTDQMCLYCSMHVGLVKAEHIPCVYHLLQHSSTGPPSLQAEKVEVLNS